MSLIKKAHSLLLQARTETNPQKAILLKKASADYYSQIITFGYIYGIVTGESNPNELYRFMQQAGSLTEQVVKLIKEKQLLTDFETRLAKRLATEFFNTSNLATMNFHNKMLKSFSIALKSKVKAEDAIHNILAGLNPVTGREYRRVEEKNQFAYAGQSNETVRNLFLVTVEELNGNPNALIQSASDDIARGIYSTISLIETRLKYGKGERTEFLEDIQNRRNQQTNIERSVEDSLPSTTEENFENPVFTLSQETINQLIDLFQKGYGWKKKKSAVARKVIAFYLFGITISFEKNDLQQFVSDEEEQELLDNLSIDPDNLMSSFGVENMSRKIESVHSMLIEKLNSSTSDFLDELEILYKEINPFPDALTETAGLQAWDKGWTNFLKEIGQDILALKNDMKLPNNPDAENEIERASFIFKLGSKKKASLKNRVASLLRRYYQI